MDAEPAGKKAVITKIEDTKITYIGDKEKVLKKFPKLKDALKEKSTKGWREIVVHEDGGFDCNS
jgi:hypothetical protein